MRNPAIIRVLLGKKRYRNQVPAEGIAGGIAQLGERLHGMQEVSGSIPLTSTTDAEVVNDGHEYVSTE